MVGGRHRTPRDLAAASKRKKGKSGIRSFHSFHQRKRYCAPSRGGVNSLCRRPPVPEKRDKEPRRRQESFPVPSQRHHSKGGAHAAFDFPGEKRKKRGRGIAPSNGILSSAGRSGRKGGETGGGKGRGGEDRQLPLSTYSLILRGG